MADYTAFPTATDAQVLLKSAGIWPTGDSNSTAYQLAMEQASQAIQEAVDAFQRETGWNPFVNSDDTVTTKSFMLDARNYVMTGMTNFRSGLLRLDSVAIRDNVITDSQRFVLQPSFAANNNAPYTHMIDLYHVSLKGLTYVYPFPVLVTGVWGFCKVVPGDVWRGVLNRAAGQLVLTLPSSVGTSSLSQDGFSKSFNTQGVAQPIDLAKMLSTEDTWNKLIQKYKRRTSMIPG